jgi:hypothetical protein
MSTFPLPQNNGAHPLALATGVQGWGIAQLPLADIASRRKSIPAWAPADTPSHFFKYSDEQTILAALAVNDAVERCQLDPREQSNWAIITAPQFLGRLAGANVFRRFRATGAPGVSPHTIPQHSLHSVSGALSVLLATRGPNVAVGGGPLALADGLLAATTLFENDAAPGGWLVCTAWDPEPQPDREGNSSSDGVCCALALALRPASSADVGGQLSIHVHDAEQPRVDSSAEQSWSVGRIVAQLSTAPETAFPHSFAWQLPWGATANLSLAFHSAPMPQAA